jgi:hypothetical protein
MQAAVEGGLPGKARSCSAKSFGQLGKERCGWFGKTVWSLEAIPVVSSI